jgi:calcineurin-like phosphoesterase family protein
VNFFSSDHHFFHANIIRYCNRPFSSVEEMNEALIQRWNAVVSPDDSVYYLGDMFMGQKKDWPGIRSRLNGLVFFVVGNHDRKKILQDMGFECVVDKLCIEHQGDGKVSRVLLQHQPNFAVASEFDFHFCGHVHEKWRRKGNIVNVGVDVWDFTPRTFDELVSAKEAG